MLTPRELNQIRDYLLMYGKKDSDLNRIADNPVALTDYVATLREDLNIKATIQDITNVILDFLAANGVFIPNPEDPENPEHMGLSHNDFTDEYKDKIDGSESGAQENRIEHVTITKEGTTSELYIDDKTVNVSFDDYVPKTYTWAGTSASNKLLNEQEINNRINEAEATFLGKCGPYDTTSATDWVTFCGRLDSYIAGGGDKNDYIFCTEVYTEDRLPDEDSRYIYHRWKYANPGATINTQWSAYKGWVYEYDVIPYYLVTDEYPQANSRNAVESHGIYAFTGDVKYDSTTQEYIPLQTQIDDVNGTIYNLHAVASFAITPSSFLIKPGTPSISTLSAVAKIVFNGANESPNNYSVALNNANWTATKNTTNNQYDCTRSSSLTTAETVTATFKKGASYSKSISSTITAYYPIYYGVTNETSNPSNIVTSNYVNSVKSSTANTGYTVTTTITNKYFFIAVPKVGGSVAEPSQYSLTAQYDSPGTLTSLGTASIEINGVNITYKFFISAPQTAATSTYYTR